MTKELRMLVDRLEGCLKTQGKLGLGGSEALMVLDYIDELSNRLNEEILRLLRYSN
jgi:hypothetical protein